MTSDSENYDFFYTRLRENILFKDVTNQSIHHLLSLGSEIFWTKRTCLVDSISTLKKFFIIISGQLKVYNFDNNKDRQFTLFLLNTNDVFDIFSLVKGYKHDVYYETLEDTLIFSISIMDMKDWTIENPIINKSFLNYTLNKMLILEHYINDVILEDTPTRLAKLILLNLNSSQDKLTNNLPHKELASLIGTTRAVLNRHIQNFKENGILKTNRNKIEISDIKKLLTLIEKGSSRTIHDHFNN